MLAAGKYVDGGRQSINTVCMDVAKNFTRSSKKTMVAAKIKHRRRLSRGRNSALHGCSKNFSGGSKILLRLQQKIVVVIVARSQLRLMDVAKNFASSNKIQLRLQLPLVVQFH